MNDILPEDTHNNPVGSRILARWRNFKLNIRGLKFVGFLVLTASLGLGLLWGVGAGLFGGSILALILSVLDRD